MMEEFIIGVDSGGTSTVAEAYSLDGQLIGRSQTGFGNLLPPFLLTWNKPD